MAIQVLYVTQFLILALKSFAIKIQTRGQSESPDFGESHNTYCVQHVLLQLVDIGGVGVMAFPIPDHLPRKIDVSSNVLSKLDSITFQSLDSSVASSYRAELDESIRLTKVFPIVDVMFLWNNRLG